MIAADRVDANVRVAQFLKLLRDEGEFGGRRRFTVEQIAALQKEMRAFRDREIHARGERAAQTRAPFRELLGVHLAVATEVVVGGADDFDHFRAWFKKQKS